MLQLSRETLPCDDDVRAGALRRLEAFFLNVMPMHCNARHTALQKLQEARKALLPLLPEDEEAAEDEESAGD